MKNNAVLDIIIEFVAAVKNGNKVISVVDGQEYKINAAGYLLGQIIRQYNIPDDHHYISLAAEEKWNKLSNDDIWNYVYRATVECTAETPVSVKKYKNNEKTPEEKELKKGDKFIFRDVFHDEHIIPIRVIIEKLINLEELTYENVKKILDNIYVCRILKEEDRNIKEKSNRPFDFEIVKNQIYAKSNIVLKCRKCLK